jgi:hypothetical protein
MVPQVRVRSLDASLLSLVYRIVSKVSGVVTVITALLPKLLVPASISRKPCVSRAVRWFRRVSEKLTFSLPLVAGLFYYEEVEGLGWGRLS